MQPALHVHNLHKTFRNGHNLKAVDGVSFDIFPGEIFSLLGPNGAGKTTTISMLSALLHPDLPPEGASEITIGGHSLQHEPRSAKALLGVVPQDIALYEDLSARENLIFWGKMYGLRGAALLQRVDEVLELIGLTARAKDRIGKYSGGMKRRVNIGAALLHRPKVIYMDEPTVGIDPQSRRSILDGVIALKQQGMTVLYTTHYMEEAQELSDRIAIMDHGKLIASGTHAGLIQLVGQKARLILTLNVPIVNAPTDKVSIVNASTTNIPTANIPTDHLSTIMTPAERLMQDWRTVPGVFSVAAAADTLTLLVDDTNRVLPQLFEMAAARTVRITSVDIQEPDLESVFLHLTGRALRDA